MAEVDSNLNYLLGRLSLVTHEFNQIKNGLGSALDNIRSSFQLVQNKMQGKLHCHSISSFSRRTCALAYSTFFVSISDAVVGPGPHKIENEDAEPEPDFNLLPQRDAPAPAE